MIELGAADGVSFEQFAARLGIGARHLRRLFTQHVGASPMAVLQTRRLHFAKQLLDETRLPITQVALASGFSSIRRFNDAFKEAYRRAPRDIRREHRQGTCDHDARIRLRLSYRPPYDWPQVLEFLRQRAIAGVEVVTDDSYERIVGTAKGYALVRVRWLEGSNSIELGIEGGESSALFALASNVRRMFDLAADPAGINTVLARDGMLRDLVTQTPGLRIPGAWDSFECGIRAIVGQQVSVPSGCRALRRLVEVAGVCVVTGRGDLTHLFPTPDAVADADLGAIGLTKRQQEALRCFAEAVRDGTIDLAGSSENVQAAVMRLHGVGPWTAGYLALRGLGDPDAFPSGDLILRCEGASGPNALSDAQLDAWATNWRPFRGYAVLHLWTAVRRNLAFKRLKRTG